MNVVQNVPAPSWVSINPGYEMLQELTDAWASKITHDAVFIRTREPLAVGTTVELRFPIALDQIYIVRGEGVVTRSEPDTPRGMEIRFTALTDRSRQIIQHVVEDLAP